MAVIDKQRRAFRAPRGLGRAGAWSAWASTATTSRRRARSDADALAAVTSGDNSNILTARIARETYKIPNVVARIYDPRRAEIYQRLGIPTVATVTWTIDQVLRRLLPDGTVGDWSDATGALDLVERSLPDAWAGRRCATSSARAT